MAGAGLLTIAALLVVGLIAIPVLRDLVRGRPRRFRP
jgi:hypothetical protein